MVLVNSIARSASKGFVPSGVINGVSKNAVSKKVLGTELASPVEDESETKSNTKPPVRRVWATPRMRKAMSMPQSGGADVDASPFELSMKNVKLKVVYAPEGMSESRKQAHQRLIWFWRYSRNWDMNHIRRLGANLSTLGVETQLSDSEQTDHNRGDDQHKAGWIWFWRWRQSAKKARLDKNSLNQSSSGSRLGNFLSLRARQNQDESAQ